jgi:hypothetical protein
MAFSNQPLSMRRSKGAGGIFGFGFFALIGLVFLYLADVQPYLMVREARSWTATPCRIVSSQVKEFDGSKGTTYSVAIEFSYRVGTQRYRTNRYDFSGGDTSSGRDEKQAVVDQYPPGKRTICYVNPSNPADAVLNREFPGGYFGLFPLVFILIGVAGIVWTLKRKQTDQTWAPAVIPASGVTTLGQTVKRPAGDIGAVAGDLPGPLHDTKPVELMPAMSSGYKALVATLVLIACGGGLAAIITSNLSGWLANSPGEGGSFVFAILLGIITIFTLKGAIVAIMRLYDPRIHVRIAPGTVRLGRDFTLQWETQGGRRQLSQLQIVLECREESLYRSGKSIVTAVSVCYRSDLVNTQQAEELATGTINTRLPDRVMHSFNGGNNKIVWKMRVIGKVQGWIGVKDEYPVVILPEGWEPAP